MPKIQVGNNFLEYHIQDCLEGMKAIQKEAVNLVITSPPYNLGGFTRNQKSRIKKMGYGLYHDDLPWNKYCEMLENVLKECLRVLKQNGTVFWNMKSFARKKKLITPFWFLDVAERNGLNLTNIIIWEFPSGADTTYSKFWGRYEYLFYFRKDKDNYIFNPDNIRVPTKYKDKRYNTDGRNPADVWHLSHDIDKEDTFEYTPWGLLWYIKHNIGYGDKHPATFPEALVRRCILACSDEDDTILDPFLGSGTTLLACKNTNRNGIGFEIDAGYESLIRKKIDADKKPIESYFGD